MRSFRFTPAIALLVAFFLFAPALRLRAQQTDTTPTQSAPADAPTVHQLAMKLLDAMGTRKVLAENVDEMIENGKEKLIQRHPELNPAFTEEWSRRMHARIDLDEFLNVIAAIYEKHFTASELVMLTRMYSDLSEQKTPQISDAFKARLNHVMPEIQTEMSANLMALNEKISTEVAASVAKDHPEFVKTPLPDAPTLQK